MPRPSFAKVVRNRREDLPEGVRPWMTEACDHVKKAAPAVVDSVAEKAKRKTAAKARRKKAA